MRKFLLFLSSVVLLAACGTTKSVPTSQSASSTYKIGDLYSQNGVTGIVVKVDESGKHGLVMSLKKTNAKWLSNKELKYSTNAFHDEDGVKNMEAIKASFEENGASWSDFPAFQWARSLGEGWYIPSRVESREAIINLETAFKKRNVSKTAVAVSKLFTSWGGDKLMYHAYTGTGIIGLIDMLAWGDAGLVSLVTSTERAGGEVVWTSGNDMCTKTMNLTFPYQYRAVHKF